MNSYMFPVMNPLPPHEWMIDNMDGTYSTVSHEEYGVIRQEYLNGERDVFLRNPGDEKFKIPVKFRTRYDSNRKT